MSLKTLKAGDMQSTRSSKREEPSSLVQHLGMDIDGHDPTERVKVSLEWLVEIVKYNCISILSIIALVFCGINLTSTYISILTQFS